MADKVREIREMQELLDRRTEMENEAIDLIGQCRFDDAVKILSEVKEIESAKPAAKQQKKASKAPVPRNPKL